MTLRRFMLRAGALVVVALALGGPTPGYVGSCSTSGPDQSVDRVQFCVDSSTWKCARDLGAGRIDMNAYNACRARIDTDCAGFNFPAGCSPSRPRADACNSALSDANRIGTRSEDIVECQSNTLCGGSALSSEGI